MKVMKRAFRMIAFCAVMLGLRADSVWGATGDSEKTAQDISVGTSYSATLVTPGVGWILTSGCYFYRVQIPHEASTADNYTIKLTGCSSADMWATVEAADEQVVVNTSPVGEYANGDAYFHIEKDDPGWGDKPYCYFYICVRGSVGKSATVTVVKGKLEYPQGAIENAYSFPAPTSSAHSETVTPINTMVYGRITLAKGVFYRFETVGGASADRLDFEFMGIPTNSVIPVAATGSSDKAYQVSAPESGTYLIMLRMSSSSVWGKKSFTFKYFIDSKRPVHLHELSGELSPLTGRAVAFQPGKMMAVAGYDDEIIDECLFSMPVEKDHFYCVKTQGAQVPLVAMVYDSLGGIVARQNFAAGSEVNLPFAATVSDGWYVGICENSASPKYVEISAWAEDVSDKMALVTFDPAPGSLDASQRSRTLPIGSPLGTLPVPTISDGDKAFAGIWLDGVGNEYTADTVITVNQLTLYPKWTSAISAALDSDLVFTDKSQSLPGWHVEEGGDGSATCVSVATSGTGTFCLQTTFIGAGTLSFSYQDPATTYQNRDTFQYSVDGGSPVSLDINKSWQRKSIQLGDGSHTVQWTFKTSATSGRTSHCGRLDRVTFEPSASPFTISWVDGGGVSAVYYSIGSAAEKLAVNGQSFQVDSGKTVSVRATAVDWHRIETDLSKPFDPKSVPSLTISAKGVSSGDVQAKGLSPADLGITQGTFAAESAGSAELDKVVTWASGHGVTVAQVNGMTFVKDPVTALEKAFLLNCAEADVDTAAAAFKFESAVMVNGVLVTMPTSGDSYGNGQVEIRTSLTPGGTFDTAEKTGEAMFYKAYLVK